MFNSSNKGDILLQGFHRIWFTPDEVAQVIAVCEERLLKTKTIAAPFTVADIQGGILKQYLIEEDYLAPSQVCPFIFKTLYCR